MPFKVLALKISLTTRKKALLNDTTPYPANDRHRQTPNFIVL